MGKCWEQIERKTPLPLLFDGYLRYLEEHMLSAANNWNLGNALVSAMNSAEIFNFHLPSTYFYIQRQQLL
jgi:hypothetical protein